MKNIQTTARWKIHDGKFEEYKKLAEECVEVTKEKSKNIIQYDCFFSQDLNECVFRENFADSEALINHVGNVGNLLGKLLELADFSAEIYGNPSEELKNVLAAFNPRIYSYYMGI